MNRHPAPDRALRQLDRHRSGNPNEPAPPRLTWGHVYSAISASAAQAALGANPARWIEGECATMNSSAALLDAEPTLTIPVDWP